MGKFCNQFDTICTELGCSVIYCHHHSKGVQGGKKMMDRSSGSGVFARDPDAVMDLIELETTDELMAQMENKAICNVCRQYLDAHWKWQDDLSQDDLLSKNRMIAYCENVLDEWQMNFLRSQLNDEMKACSMMSAWRLEGTLREFPRLEPIDLWFRYPIHRIDRYGTLTDVKPEIEKTSYEVRRERSKEKAAKEKKNKIDSFIVAFDGLEDEDGKVFADDLAQQLACSQKTLLGWLGSGKRAIPELASSYKKSESNGNDKVYISRKTK